MGPKVRDQIASTLPNPSLSVLPSLKPLASESPWILTPPLHPTVSIPFEWEEAPGRPRTRPINMSSPCKPKIVRCLELPPGMMMVEAKGNHMPSSPTTVLDGPRPARSLSHRFCFEGRIPNTSLDLNLDIKEKSIMDRGKSKSEVKRQIGPWKRWASGNGTKWNQELGKGNSGMSARDDTINDMDIEVKVTRLRRSKGSLYKLSNTTYRVFEIITGCLKRIRVPRRKQEKKRTEAP